MDKAAPNAQTLVFKADVAKENDVKELVDVTVSRFGRLDVMFNNAGESSPPIEWYSFSLYVGIMHPADDNAITTEEATW